MANLPAVRTEGASSTGDLTQLVSFHLDNEEYGVEVLMFCSRKSQGNASGRERDPL
jgi:hypothetical protein